jgi:hypothetical protein
VTGSSHVVWNVPVGLCLTGLCVCRPWQTQPTRSCSFLGLWTRPSQGYEFVLKGTFGKSGDIFLITIWEGSLSWHPGVKARDVTSILLHRTVPNKKNCLPLRSVCCCWETSAMNGCSDKSLRVVAMRDDSILSVLESKPCMSAYNCLQKAPWFYTKLDEDRQNLFQVPAMGTEALVGRVLGHSVFTSLGHESRAQLPFLAVAGPQHFLNPFVYL